MLLCRIFLVVMEIPLGSAAARRLGVVAAVVRGQGRDRTGGGMRILHVTDHYPPVLGGIEAHVAGAGAPTGARGAQRHRAHLDPAHAPTGGTATTPARCRSSGPAR